MIDFVEYLLKEVRRKAVSKADALALLEQYGGAAEPRERLDVHPFLHTNSSTLAEQRFSTTFSGEEFFLRDHVIRGEPVLPAVAYLEMARAASLHSLYDGTQTDDSSALLALKDVVWVRPLVLKEAEQVHIGLCALQSGEIEFEVYTRSKGARDEGDRTVHARGCAVPRERVAGPQQLAVESLRNACRDSLSVESCYESLNALGLQYGPAYRGLTSIAIGNDDRDQRFVLARVDLPACVADDAPRYYLHPSVLDSALQAFIGLSLTADIGRADAHAMRPFVPLALDELEILASTPEQAWVFVRRAVSDPGIAAPESDGILKLDVEIADSHGRICTRLRGLAARALDRQASAARPPALLLTPHWEEKPLPQGAANGAESVDPDRRGRQHIVILDAAYRRYLSELQALQPSVSWEILLEPAGADSIGERVCLAGEHVFGRVQAILLGKPREAVTLQVVLGERADELDCALSGLLRSANRESTRLKCQLISVELAACAADLARIVTENAARVALDDVEIRYASRGREVTALKELEAAPSTPSEELWKDDGVYLITGGAGALGMILARDIVQRAPRATAILVGRAALGAERSARLEALRVGGARIEYRPVDVCDGAATRGLVADVLSRHGRLNGVVHAAGIIRDSLIVRKPVADFRAVLAPKIAGTLSLDAATQDVALDFFLLFSSIAGAIGNAGQADYAMGNAFLDRFVSYRDKLVALRERRGRTLSINWPLWLEGGMAVDDATREQLHRHGIEELPTDEGVDALHSTWRRGVSRVAVFSFRSARAARQIVGAQPRSSAARPEPSSFSSKTEAPGLRDRVEDALKREIAQQLKVDASEIDPEAQFSEFGFDSITLTALGTSMQRSYGLDVSPTVFFEYPTLRTFADYLLTAHADALEELFAAADEASSGERQRVDARENAEPLRPQSPVLPGSHARERRRFASRLHARPAEPVVSRFEPIAVIGMSGRFPGAPDLDAFWRNLEAGKDAITEIPQQRWDWRSFYGDPRSETNKTNIRYGGFIDGIGEFDPLFFGISPREARFMDPQQRLLMTWAWKAVEDAGYNPMSLSGSNTGVFFGTGTTGYSQLVAESGEPIEGYSSIGATPSMGPNRLSYFLDLHGPSEPIETACSSSLVAIHRAVRAIHAGDCEMALAGGANTIIVPWAHISFSRAGMLAEDGRCKAFAAGADGYVRGEGVGILLLKKLAAAERDGDIVHAVIRGSAENHGGRASSLTAPNPKAQSALIRAAHEAADIDPRTVTYIEAHGTGTQLGDPIEVNALRAAFSQLYESNASEREVGANHCGIGTVKTNIGHLEMAAGVAGLIKVILQMKHRKLAASLHCEQVNPLIQLVGTPFHVVTQTQPWKALTDRAGLEVPRRAGVSSFGFGGVNAHVVIEEYSPQRARAAADKPHAGAPALIVLSAKDGDRLREQTQQLLDYVRSQQPKDEDLIDIAYTLQVGREPMEHRVAFDVVTANELELRLSRYLEGVVAPENAYRGEKLRGRAAASAQASDDSAELLETYVEQRDYGRLLDSWAHGASFDWRKLYRRPGAYERCAPRRRSLPTYPFARTRYWIGKESLAPPVSVAAAAVSAAAPEATAIVETPVVAKEIARSVQEVPTAPAVAAEVPASQRDVEDLLVKSLAETMDLPPDQIDREAPFSALGMDSVIGVAWVQALDDRYGLGIEVSSLFDYPSVRALAEHLEEQTHSRSDTASPNPSPGGRISLLSQEVAT
jgi:acyl transferase domain-containing protein